MATKRIDRSDLLSALAQYAPELSRFDFLGFINHFFKDVPEWRGDANRLKKRLQELDHLTKRNQQLLKQNLQLKQERFDGNIAMEQLKALNAAQAQEIARLSFVQPEQLLQKVTGTGTKEDPFVSYWVSANGVMPELPTIEVKNGQTVIKPASKVSIRIGEHDIKPITGPMTFEYP